MIQKILNDYEERILHAIRDKKIGAINETHWYNRTRKIYGLDSEEDKNYRRLIQTCEFLLKEETTHLLFDIMQACGYYTQYYHSETMFLMENESRKMLVIPTTPTQYDSAHFHRLLNIISEIGATENRFVLLSPKTTVPIIHPKHTNNLNSQWDFLQDFIIELLGAAIWDKIEKFFIKIVPEVRKLLGYSLIKICDDNELKEFKDIEKKVLSNLDYQSLNKKYCMKHPIEVESMKKINEQFFSNSTIEILLGDFDYADSFITAEWLYHQMPNFQSLEKTPIAVGYLKSVEQLLFRAISVITPGRKIQLPNRSIGTTGEEIPATLGNIEIFLRNNIDIFLTDIRSRSIENILKIISDWRNNYRNGHLHRHNITEDKEVSDIREMTILMLYIILGSLRINQEILEKMK